MRWGRALAALGAVAVVLLPIAPASADVVVDGAEVGATVAEVGDTAQLSLINTGAREVRLPETVGALTPDWCLVTVATDVLPAYRSTTVTLDFAPGCFPANDSVVRLDLDADGPLPVVTVSAPTQQHHDWEPMVLGLLVATVLAGVVVGAGAAALGDTARARREAGTGEAGATRGRRYAAATDLVGRRLREVGATPVWRPLTGPSVPTWRSPIAGLAAGWSFKDSWISSITVATPALVALLGSADAFTAVVGETPTAALGVVTVTGLVSAVVIALAVAVVKLVDSPREEVSVRGLVAATALVVLAAELQVITAGLSAIGVLDTLVADVVVGVLMVLVAVAVLWYAVGSLRAAVADAAPDRLPEVPDDALTAWAAHSGWEEEVVRGRLRAAYAPWLEDADRVPTATSLPIGTRAALI